MNSDLEGTKACTYTASCKNRVPIDSKDVRCEPCQLKVRIHTRVSRAIKRGQLPLIIDSEGPYARMLTAEIYRRRLAKHKRGKKRGARKQADESSSDSSSRDDASDGDDGNDRLWTAPSEKQPHVKRSRSLLETEVSEIVHGVSTPIGSPISAVQQPQPQQQPVVDEWSTLLHFPAEPPVPELELGLVMDLIHQWTSSLHPATELAISAHQFAEVVYSAHSPQLAANLFLALMTLLKRLPLDPYRVFWRAVDYLPAMKKLREVYKDPPSTLIADVRKRFEPAFIPPEPIQTPVNVDQWLSIEVTV